MAQTPEGKVKARLKQMFRAFEPDLYWFCPVQAGYGAAGLDFHCTFRGEAFFVETKAPGRKLTKRQNATQARIELAGCRVFVVDSDTGIQEVKEWLTKRINSE